jgi:hypothetical protein
MRTPLRSLGLLGLGLLCLVGAGQWHSRLISMRSEFQLQVVPPEDTTPLVTLTTVAFGGFRGLVADVLWVRASNLQEEGKYFELVQLSKWISQLEPRVPEVWSFQAWNLSYNISVFFPNHEDRWRWVHHGIDLLKKQGLKHNPASSALHWDIGWMYQHKIGMIMDDAYPLYRQKVAGQMQDILGGAFLPEALSSEQQQRITSELSMDPEVMRQLDRMYGPIDWRLPEAHSLYWSFKGQPLAVSRFDKTSLQRMTYSSLRFLMMKGTALGNPAEEPPILLPRPELIPILVDQMASQLEDNSDSTLIRTYQALLLDAMSLYAEYGDFENCMELYDRLAELDEQVAPGNEAFRQWLQTYVNQHPAELSSDAAMMRIVAALRRSIALEAENPVRAAGLKTVARQTHRLFQASRTNPDLLARTGLPPFERMEAELRAMQKNPESF